MSDATILGRFVWHELLTTDTKSAEAFFSKVVGWKSKPWAPDGSYTIFLMGKSQMAGLMALPDDAKKMGAPPHWLSYVGTPNVDETARHAEALGAKVLKAATDIPTVGRFAVLADPQGAVFALFTPNQAPSAEKPAELGDFSWHELATTDGPAALTFYKTLFGWEATSAMDMGPGMGVYQMFGRNGRPMGGMFTKPPAMPGPSAWSAYIRVPDAKKAAATSKKLGGQIVHGPAEVPGGDWIAQGMDLQGAMFAVHAVKPAAPAAAPKAATPKASAPKAISKKAVAKKAAPKKAAVKKAAMKKAQAKKVAVKASAKKKRSSKAKPAKAVKKGGGKAKGKARKAGKKR